MRKTFVSIIIALLVFSIPVFAQETESSDSKSQDVASNKVNGGTYGLKSASNVMPRIAKGEKRLDIQKARTEAQNIRQQSIEDAKAKRGELKEKRQELKEEAKNLTGEERKNFAEKAREEIKEKREEIKDERKQKFEEAKNKVVEAAKVAKERIEASKIEQKQVREKITGVKEKVNECKSSKNETDECKNLRKEVRADTMKFLASTADRVLGLIQKTKEHVQNSKISEADKTSIISEIDAQLKNVVELKDSLSELSESSSAEDVKKLTEELRGAWKETQNIIRLGTGKIAVSKLGGVVERTEKLQSRLDATLAKLKEKNVDISSEREKLGQFSTLISEAKKLSNEAGELFARKDSTKTDEIMKQATEKLKEANKKINDAHAILKEILKLIKEHKEGEKALEEASK